MSVTAETRSSVLFDVIDEIVAGRVDPEVFCLETLDVMCDAITDLILAGAATDQERELRDRLTALSIARST